MVKKRFILHPKNSKRKPPRVKRKTSGKNAGKKTLKQLDKGGQKYKKIKAFKKKKW